jgi:hypothetical protein
MEKGEWKGQKGKGKGQGNGVRPVVHRSGLLWKARGGLRPPRPTVDSASVCGIAYSWLAG